jgi:methyltransferase-like protein
MQYYHGIETIVLQCDSKGLNKKEKYLLKKMDGTYSTSTNIEICLLKVHIKKYIIDGQEKFICTPSANNSDSECFEIQIDDIVEFKGVNFVSAKTILSYLYRAKLEGGMADKIKYYFQYY